MASHQQSDLESNAADSTASSPRSDYPPNDPIPRVRFMCSFGGQILPRPHDNQLRYVGGDTRIVAVHRSTSFSSLLAKLSKLSSIADFTVKYQLPNEDLDALISVTMDEDVDNMMEEYDRLVLSGNAKSARLRLFLFPAGISRASSISSILDSTRRENWFFDALNGGSGSARLDRGRSEVSSMLSEVPDYLFGLDNAEETKPRNRHVVIPDNISASDPGSPAPVVTSSPYCSTTSIPDLPPVKTKVENPNPNLNISPNPNPNNLNLNSNLNPNPTLSTTPVVDKMDTGEEFMTQQTGYPGNSMWHYEPEPQYPTPAGLQPMPVYYVPGPVPGTNIPVQVQRVPVQAPYMQRFPVPVGQGQGQGQLPVGYRSQISNVGQVYGGGMRPVRVMEGYEYPGGVMQDQGVYYGGRNAGLVPGYQGTTMIPNANDAPEMQMNKATHPH